MTLAEALVADRQGRTQDAATVYEAVLLSAPDDLTATMNLAVLYWQATDFGNSAAEHLPPEFVAHAGKRLRELVGAAQGRFPREPEVLFWSRYVAWADVGEPFDPAECRELLRLYPDYLEPAFVLFSRSAGTEAEVEAMKLLERCSEDPTARNRYIVSVIKGVLKRRRPKKSGSPT